MPATEPFVFDAIRTPRGKGKVNGSLHSTKPVDLVVGLMHEMLSRNADLDPTRVDDVVLGCASPIGDQGADIAKTAAVKAGLPDTVSGVQLNRFCASGLEAVNQAARGSVIFPVSRARTGTTTRSTSDFFAFAPIGELTAVVDQQAELISGQAVSGGYYAGLKVQPSLGRGITDEDDKPGAASVVVLSYQFWQDRLGANPVIGQPLKLNKQSLTIIGVTPLVFASGAGSASRHSLGTAVFGGMILSTIIHPRNTNGMSALPRNGSCDDTTRSVESRGGQSPATRL